MPISVKGIVFDESSVWLRKNERNEWELPGGKIDQGEQPTETVIRELREELGFDVEVVKVIHAWMYKIQKSQDELLGVLVLSYLCRLVSKIGTFEIEGEAGRSEFRRFNLDEIEKLNIPEFYKNAIHLGWNEFLRIEK
ncbi:NUDIX hydrolase [Candidatus Falkowbacteria bacterium]|nr:NUDIX hydrolase [Candidatus Falkowbacteria bacterium]